MAHILLDRIHFYAYHGCLPQETAIGSEYELQLSIEFDIEKVGVSDNLELGIDYCTITDIALSVATETHKLLETIVYKIGQKLLDEIPDILSGEVTLYKITPPINARVDKVGISHTFTR